MPSTDIGSVGPYGVYHSTFDDYSWFMMNADPHFVYEQEMARVLGLDTLHMADADILPYDYVTYAKEICGYLEVARTRATGQGLATLDFSAALQAANRFARAATAVYARQVSQQEGLLDSSLRARAVEGDLLTQEGLPGRPWFKHAIFAPGEYTGYAGGSGFRA